MPRANALREQYQPKQKRSMERATKIGISTGVASSLLVMYLIDPVLKIFGDFLYFAFNGMYTGFLDSLYSKAALGTPKDPALIIFSMITGIITGIGAGLLSAFARKSRDQLEDSHLKIKKTQILAFVASMLFLVFISLYQTWTLLLQHQVVTSFYQHIRAVTPYIAPHERDILISKFSLMSSQSDYQEIYKTLNGIAEKNNFKLPENPSYNLWSF